MDDGVTWQQITFCTEEYDNPISALTSKGTTVFALTANNGGTSGADSIKNSFVKFDATTVTNTELPKFELDKQKQYQSVSLAINDAGTELHAVWSSKNATYPNSFNIRYAKGTINPDGSVTWGAVEQVTVINASSNNYTNPSVTLDKSGIPVILVSATIGITDANNINSNSSILVIKRDRTLLNTSTNINSNWSMANVYSVSSSYVQSNPSALFVPTAINGLANGRLWVAWHGKDATDSAKFNIRTSFSDDGGVTWATPVKLTSGNTVEHLNVSLSADKTGKVFALYEDHEWAPDTDIWMRVWNGTSWGAEASVAFNEPNPDAHPSALVDFNLRMTTPPFVFTDSTAGIKFSGNFNVGASVSPASGALGNKETATLTAYTVTPEAGSTVTSIVEKVNGVTVNTFNNPASLSRTLTVPTATWDTLAYFASHTASVTVTDSNGATTVTTYSFAKALATNASLLEATKANTDAKNRISTKRDALAAQVGLSAGSTFDAISAQLASGSAYMKVAKGTIPESSTGALVTVNNLSFRPKIVIIHQRVGASSYDMVITEDAHLIDDSTILNYSISVGKSSDDYQNASSGLTGDRSTNLSNTPGNYDGRIINNGFEFRTFAGYMKRYSYVAFG